MKFVLFLAITFSSPFLLYAQNALQLKKDQVITVTSVTSMDADMGMGMQMKNNSNSVNKLVVIGEDDKNFLLTNTLTSIRLTLDAMGQQTDYDSDKAEDRNSEMGKAVGERLNKTDSIQIDKKSGSLILSYKDNNSISQDPPNPMQGIMDAMGSSEQENLPVTNAFFIIPTGKKVGDTWTDSSTNKNSKTVKTYILSAIDKNMATIRLAGTIQINTAQEIQGAAVNISMTTALMGDIITDIQTGLVSKQTLLSDVSGTIDMMGQSMPVSSKVASTFTYQY